MHQQEQKKVFWAENVNLFTLFLQGLIFVVDSNDRERAQEAAEELQKMVSEPRPNITIFKSLCCWTLHPVCVHAPHNVLNFQYD